MGEDTGDIIVLGGDIPGSDVVFVCVVSAGLVLMACRERFVCVSGVYQTELRSILGNADPPD